MHKGKLLERMASISVVNKAGEVVADGVTPDRFMAFKRQCGRGCAVLVVLGCGEEIFMDTVKLMHRLPRGVYSARLLRRVAAPPEGLDAAGHNVWIEA